MDEHEWLVERFEENRTHLRSVAYRMLGSLTEADDAVQESWLRLSRADTSGVENLGGWLTVVVGRVCLDMLRSRRSRREESLDERAPETIESSERGSDPEKEALLADSVGLALLVVLETLAPAERLALVLHDMFEVPFDAIAPIVGRSPAAARQLASRARRRVRTARTGASAEPNRQQEVVNAFLAASREGNFDALLALLDPEVVLRADPASVRMGAAAEVRGAPAVAGSFSGRARAAQAALINGMAGAVWARDGGATRRVRLHARQREDRHHRPDCRRRQPEPARTGDAQRLTRHRASESGTSSYARRTRFLDDDTCRRSRQISGDSGVMGELIDH